MAWQQYRGWIIGLAITIVVLALVIIYNVDWQECLNSEPEVETSIATCVTGQLETWWQRRERGLRQAAITGVLSGSVLGLVALGLTLIFGVLDIVNFAHGALMTVGLYITFILFDSYGIDPYLALVVTVPSLFVIGIIAYRLVIHPARNAPQHNQLLLTLGLSLLIENALLLIFTGTPQSIRLPYGRGEIPVIPGVLSADFPLKPFGTTITFTRLVAFFGAVILTAILYLILQRTDMGRAIRATAQDTEGAALVGINIDRINMLTFGIGTACVGAAAALVLPFPLQAEPTAGNIFNITAFVIVVLGGMGDVRGALLGGLIIGLTQEFTLVLFRGVPKEFGIFVIFILVLLLRPQGLFGGKDA